MMNMKATGIIRRIDDLGRVVIPKELRRKMNIFDGDPLEIYTADCGQIIFKKYSAVTDLDEASYKCVKILAKKIGCAVLLTDMDQIIFSGGTQDKGISKKELSPAVRAIIRSKELYVLKDGDPIYATNCTDFPVLTVIPITAEIDTVGVLIVRLPENRDSVGEREIDFVQYTADVIASRLMS